MTENSLIIYRTDDGLTEIQLRAIDGRVWLTQAEIADLFQTTPQNITLHVKTIFDSGELLPEATCKEYLQVRSEGQRQVERQLKHYSLDMILAVGYRISSSRGVQFRQWATTTLREYLVKGFVMNDERLKNPGAAGADYFDELLERIRDIRASEKLFYQKVKDVYTRSMDYDAHSDQAQLFFKTVQNKMLYAVTGHTAAELVVQRCNSDLPNSGLTTWEGAKKGRGVRKADVVTAKNYLTQEEMESLNRIVTMFLDTAEDTAKRRKAMYMKDWELLRASTTKKRTRCNSAGRNWKSNCRTTAKPTMPLWNPWKPCFCWPHAHPKFLRVRESSKSANYWPLHSRT